MHADFSALITGPGSTQIRPTELCLHGGLGRVGEAEWGMGGGMVGKAGKAGPMGELDWGGWYCQDLSLGPDSSPHPWNPRYLPNMSDT